MKFGLLTSILEGTTFEEAVDFAAENGLQCLEVACWPASGGGLPLKTLIGCGMVYTAVSISVGSVPNCMTTSNADRVKLQSSRNIIGNIASLIINAIAMPMILHFGKGKTTNAQGYFTSALIFSLLSIPCLIICFLSIRETINPDRMANGQAKEKKKEKGGFLHSLGQCFADHDARMLILAMIFVLIAIMGYMGIRAYYYVYILGDANLMSPCVRAMGIGMCCMRLKQHGRILETSGILSV